jgi:hypothetical protein
MNLPHPQKKKKKNTKQIMFLMWGYLGKSSFSIVIAIIF